MLEIARLSKEKVKAINKEISKNSDVFKVLNDCGGALYVEDLANILGKPISTLKYQIKKSIELKLLYKIKSPVGTTSKDVIRLTDGGWRRLGVNRGMVSAQDNTVDICLYRAILNKNLNFNSIKKELLSDLKIEDIKKTVVDSNNAAYNLKSISENIYKIEKSNKLLVKDYYLDVENKKVYLDFYYVNRKLKANDFMQLIEFIDMLIGIFEWYCFWHDDDFFHCNNYIKMNLTVITEDSYNPNDKLKAIKKYTRNYHAFTKERCKFKPKLFYSIGFIFDNKINFMKIDKDNYSFKKL